MKLQQLRYLCEIVKHELNISTTADAIYTSQPGISKQIQALEEELGVKLFTRSGKQLTGLTDAGADIVILAREILQHTQNIKRIAEEHRDHQTDQQGQLSHCHHPYTSALCFACGGAAFYWALS
ncbi:LysR family transcriptional regulator [Thioflexithrix psekupsensis]|uniref:LysR family transcriptional regulator n=1 Tax=Thioflexithrix psekupsensis TaxID=1570016 RepID=UPI001FD9DFAD|nr:LysR family transcriptional regulator [Thioflexithrix psekupsensis]